MRYLSYALLLVGCLLVSAMTFLFVAAPVDLLRDQIISSVKQHTGRDLSVLGATHLRLFPSIGVELEDVGLSAPDDMTAPPLVQMAALRVDVPLLPLLQRRLEIKRFILSEPRFELIVDATGRKSWDFAASRSQGGERGLSGSGNGGAFAGQGNVGSGADAEYESRVPATTAGGSTASDPLGQLSGLRLGDVRIENGRVRYSDARSGIDETIEAISFSIALDSLDSPLAAEGSATWRGTALPLQIRAETPARLLAGDAARAVMALKSDMLELDVQGDLIIGAKPGFKGAVRLAASSMQALSTWLGSSLPSRPGAFGAIALRGELVAGTGAVHLANAELQMDDIAAAGEVGFFSGGPRPRVEASLQVAMLDLNPYLGTSGSPASSSTSSDDGATRAGARDPIGGLIERVGAQSETSQPVSVGRLDNPGGGSGSGWSTEPIDVTALRAMDARLDLVMGGLIANDIKIDKATARVRLADGLLNIGLEKLELYGGGGEGRISVDARAAQPEVAGQFKLAGVSAGPILRDAAGFSAIDGRMQAELSLRGSGPHQQAIVSSLQGDGSFNFRDGSIHGANLPLMLRNIQAGRFNELGKGEGEKTDFSELSASAKINRGLANNQDLRLVSPLLRVTGTGIVDLPRQRVDYGLRPRLVASLEGQGASGEADGLEIPVRVRGPWDRPDIQPDLAGVLQNPSSVVEAVSGLARKVGGGEIVDKLRNGGTSSFESLVSNALGRGNENDGAASGEISNQNDAVREASDALKKLFQQ